jgi:hypothetical protein
LYKIARLLNNNPIDCDGNDEARPNIEGLISFCIGVGMKTDRIRTDITDIVFVFIFMSGFGFEYG